MLALGAIAGWAYPTMSGATGLVTLPTAEVVPQGVVDIAVDYQDNVGEAIEMYDTEDVQIMPIRATIGVAESLEVWGGYTLVKVEDWDDAKLWNVGGKYQIMSEAAGDDVSVAVGGSFGKFDNDIEVDVTNAFLVASKDISTSVAPNQPIGATAHLGVIWIDLEDTDIDESLTEPFIGLEIFGEKGASLVVEYRFKDDSLDDSAPFSAALRYPIGESPLMIQVGTTNAAFAGIGADDNEFFVGLCYTLGEPAAMGSGGGHSWGY